jgi:hypothetical protein
MTRYNLWRRSGLLFVAAVCATLSSCIPAKEPLSDAMKSEPNKDLIGTWVREEDEGMRIMLIGRHELLADEADKPVPRGLMSYGRSFLRKDGRLVRDLSGVFFVSQIKGEGYANVFGDNVVQEARRKGAWGYPEDTAFYPVRYTLEKDTLTIFYPEADRVKAAINKGALKGTVRGDDVEMAGGTALADYLAKEGGKSLFPDESAEKWQRAKVVPAK